MVSGRDTFEKRKSISMEEICDKCGDEVDSSDSMPDPEAGTGSLCPECYEEAASRFDLKKGAEWIRQQLPSMEVVFGRPDAEVARDAASGDGTWFGGTMCQL
jgi:NAD-dependent SIR2 family protein deacetylase